VRRAVGASARGTGTFLAVVAVVAHLTSRPPRRGAAVATGIRGPRVTTAGSHVGARSSVVVTRCVSVVRRSGVGRPSVTWFILTHTARPARRVGPRRITSINATLGPVSRATSTSPRARVRAAAGIARPRRPRLATAMARCSSGTGGATGCGLGRRHPVILLAHRL
jgi:hypothetical protein